MYTAAGVLQHDVTLGQIMSLSDGHLLMHSSFQLVQTIFLNKAVPRLYNAMRTDIKEITRSTANHSFTMRGADS
ncbi:hypothetical protein BDR04DRAFT_769354 [Suillus decipiens]|nr:hypothetical protein BDR04DRAFT_769354 [Suillus decipiens]